MIEIREFELKARDIFSIWGKCLDLSMCISGKKLIATGVCAQLRTDDYVASTHRVMTGHALAKGIPGARGNGRVDGRDRRLLGWPWGHHASG